MRERVLRRCFIGAAGLAVVQAVPRLLAAQITDSTKAPRVTPDSVAAIEPASRQPAKAERWRTSYFPYLAGGANDSPVFSFRVRHWQPAEYEARSTYTAVFNADAGIASKGSRYVAASFK